MDYNQALEALERLLDLMETVRNESPTRPEIQKELSTAYGECEPIIIQILGEKPVSVPAAGGLGKETYANVIEAGYLSSRTTYRHAGYQQLLKVIGRVRQLANDPMAVIVPASVSQLLAALRRFRECCQFLAAAPNNERAVQDIVWIMLRSHFDRLDREETLPKFGLKAYRPDFGVPDLATLVEVKYIGDAKQVKGIQEELLADVPGYLNEISGFSGLIILVYDAVQALRDSRPFIDDLKSVEGIVDVIVVPGIG